MNYPTFLKKLEALNPSLDERDQAILFLRAKKYNSHQTPQVGDFVRFPDLPVLRRISHIWFDEKAQTSDGGSFYLGDGSTSFSGSLYQSVPIATMELTSEIENGCFWFFHHNLWEAHNGIYVQIPCRVWNCTVNAPR